MWADQVWLEEGLLLLNVARTIPDLRFHLEPIFRPERLGYVPNRTNSNDELNG